MAQRIIRPEDYKRGTKPLEPEHRADPAKLPERKVDIADDQTVLIKSLVGIRFIRVEKDVIKDAAKAGIEIKDLPVLDNDEFRAILKPYLGKPVTMRSISLMVRDAIRYYRLKDRPVVDVFVPEQEITKGVVQLMVIEARVSEVKVKGLNWFSDELIRGNIRLETGDIIRAKELLKDIDYINTNPFVFVRPVLEPGKEVGTTDIIIDGKDRLPMRVYAGYDDTGSRATGLERFFVGGNLGNVLGLGHELGYQYTTNRRFDDFGIHSAYWRIPLPNRDTLSFFGNYADYNTSVSSTTLGSVNWMVHVRYTAPLPSTPNLRHELEFGFDFRRADNDLQTAGTKVYDDYIDVAQFAFQYAGRGRDKYGDTAGVVNVYWSPCSNFLSNHQNLERYEAVRVGSSTRYVYAHMSLERLWILPKDWSFFNRLTAQVSNRRLPPTEQFGIGGYRTVRGFDERDVNSDQGLMATVELRTPRIDLKIKDEAKNLPSYLQFLAFCDYGHSRNRGHYATENKALDLLSVGAGLRVRVSDHVHVRVDYGHKLHDVNTSNSGGGRFHLYLLLSY